MLVKFIVVIGLRYKANEIATLNVATLNINLIIGYLFALVGKKIDSV
ncbi:hypothetical protein IMPERIA89_280266 [Imperialibacter sp. 89]|nr:hypothetical protein IMPERIA89_280266 [Imperialibacter sp. 89]